MQNGTTSISGKHQKLIEQHLEHIERLEQTRIMLLLLQKQETLYFGLSEAVKHEIRERTNRLLHLNDIAALLVQESLQLIRKEE